MLNDSTMDELKMQEDPHPRFNLILNYVIAVMLFIGIIYLGMEVKDYISAKIKARENPTPNIVNLDQDAQLARVFWGTGVVFFVIMIVIYIILKSASKQKL